MMSGRFLSHSPCRTHPYRSAITVQTDRHSNWFTKTMTSISRRRKVLCGRGKRFSHKTQAEH